MNHMYGWSHGWMGGWIGGGMWLWTIIVVVMGLLVVLIVKVSNKPKG